MDEARRRTLQTLIDLAGGSNPADCWDDRRAEDLLRSQSSPAELRELGMDERVIAHIFEGAAASGEERRPEQAGVAGDFAVRVEARFEAAHYLREYRGITEPLHGHSYKVEALLSGPVGGLDGDAIAVDFVSARRSLEALAKRLDYTCINDVTPFDSVNPTAENIASWFADELAKAVRGEGARVREITIWEGPVNSVTFRPR